MLRADIITLTLSYLIKTQRECAPDDALTDEYNEMMNFVGKLVNKPGNRIPASRSDGVNMYKATKAVITDGSQMSLKASFIEYITYITILQYHQHQV